MDNKIMAAVNVVDVDGYGQVFIVEVFGTPRSIGHLEFSTLEQAETICSRINTDAVKIVEEMIKEIRDDKVADEYSMQGLLEEVLKRLKEESK